MFCTNCGKQFRMGCRVCPYCGDAISMPLIKPQDAENMAYLIPCAAVLGFVQCAFINMPSSGDRLAGNLVGAFIVWYIILWCIGKGYDKIVRPVKEA